MLDETLGDAKKRMSDTVEALKRDMAGIRTGRASTGLVDNLKIDYFGSDMPLNQLAQINVGDARMLVIQPWDKNAIDPIAKAIQRMATPMGAASKPSCPATRLIALPRIMGESTSRTAAPRVSTMATAMTGRHFFISSLASSLRILMIAPPSPPSALSIVSRSGFAVVAPFMHAIWGKICAGNRARLERILSLL